MGSTAFFLVYVGVSKCHQGQRNEIELEAYAKLFIFTYQSFRKHDKAQ